MVKAKEFLNNERLMPEDWYVARLEDLTNRLKVAVLEQNLQLPEISSFERYLSKLTVASDIIYVMGLLNHTWIYVYPRYLFDEYIDCDLDQWFEIKKTARSLGFEIETQKIFYDKADYNALSIKYYKEVEQFKLEQSYGEYLHRLLEIARNACKKYDISIMDCFLVKEKLPMTRASLTMDQINAIYSTTVDFSFLANTPEIKKNFFALFDITPHSPTGQMQWLDYNEKNNTPSVASLYTLFDTIGVKMGQNAQRIIAKHFINSEGGPIDPSSLKNRTDTSEALKKYRDSLNLALMNYKK